MVQTVKRGHVSDHSEYILLHFNFSKDIIRTLFIYLFINVDETWN